MKCETSDVAGNLEDITLLTVLLEHDKFREEHFQQCLVSFGDSFLMKLPDGAAVFFNILKNVYITIDS